MARGGQNLEVCFLSAGVTLNREADSFRPQLTQNNGVDQAIPEDILSVVFYYFFLISPPDIIVIPKKLTILKYKFNEF